ncbi:MAG TPA: SGNH/GDSL hydrolase family protein [Ramlibacter sp.]|uniref:SGNH/GDSL hydrolase family protein n=1 Tax=Ramlibacter sp. TaxID=1917967 RepID=UPI002B934624|nr:SGNH/GDSL hydrolase family protein [Ramlibacter sp.]HVZ47124.1 SGNH/GDSL hydrolase family protein [Ramlibacter sp.]
MTRFPLRRALAWVAAASALLLAACGSSTIESQLVPARVVVFGDSVADLGQTSNASVANARYTVNDGTIGTWTQEVAARFGINLTTAALGGTSYATGNARVATHPDAAGNAATPTVAEQIDTFLAGNSFSSNDLVLVSAGTGDVISEVWQYVTGAETHDQMMADIGQAGRDLGAQIRRLVNAGAKQVVVVGPYDLSKSPIAIATGKTAPASEASSRFNEQLLVSIVDLGANVLYVDAAFYFNLLTSVPSAYGLTDATTAVCTTVDPGPGIGFGAGQLNSALCTAATIRTSVSYDAYAFADGVYFTPAANRLFGDVAWDRIHARF